MLQEMLKAIEGGPDSDWTRTNSILALRSHQQLKTTFDEVAKISGRDILDVVARSQLHDMEKKVLQDIGI